jgi:hypothetical protein
MTSCSKVFVLRSRLSAPQMVELNVSNISWAVSCYSGMSACVWDTIIQCQYFCTGRLDLHFPLLLEMQWWEYIPINVEHTATPPKTLAAGMCSLSVYHLSRHAGIVRHVCMYVCMYVCVYYWLLHSKHTLQDSYDMSKKEKK